MLSSLVPWLLVLTVMVLTVQQIKFSMMDETVDHDVGTVVSLFASSLTINDEEVEGALLSPDLDDGEEDGYNQERNETEGDFNSFFQATAAAEADSALLASSQQHRPKKQDRKPTRRQEARLAQRRRQRKQWFSSTNHPYHFSLPVIVLSLPKSGTTSVASFFQCGGIHAAHTYGRRRSAEGKRKPFRIGECIKENYYANRPLLKDCKPEFYAVYSDIGDFPREGEGECFYPSIQALDRLVADYPNATFILSFRHEGWLESVENFNNLRKRWQKRCPIFPNTTNPAVWQDFYQQHRQRIRNVVAQNPGVNYLEFNLTDPMAGQKLSRFTGIDAQCWQNCKPDNSCIQRTHLNDTALALLEQETT